MSLASKYGVRDIVPEGKMGRWRVKHFSVSEEDSEKDRTRAMITFSGGGRWTPPGDYAGLYRGDTIVMSDTPAEIRDHLDFIREARGEVLIHGLGIGMCAAAALRKEEVDHVTVVEVASEVIELVGVPLADALGGPSVSSLDFDDKRMPEMLYPLSKAPIQRQRLTVVHGDALEWKPPTGAVWDVVWHDIWDNLCTDNLEDMKRLHRRFGGRKLHWQGSWCRELLEDRRRREKAAGW